MVRDTSKTKKLNNHGPLKNATLKEQAYSLIKDAILYRRLQKNVVYSQDDLCEELGISRTPVREALIELQNENFISFVRGRGFKVVELTKKEALDIVEMRRDIELFGAELAAKRINDDQLTRLEAKHEKMADSINSKNTKLLYSLDYDFHNIIFEATGNSWLIDTIIKLRTHFLRVETQSAFSDIKTAKAVLKEHEGVVEALKKHNPKMARKAMEHHLNCTYKRTVTNILNDVSEKN